MPIPEGWSFVGKVAVVTGAARGIGRSTVELLQARGARVVASDRSEAVSGLAAEKLLHTWARWPRRPPRCELSSWP